MKLTHENQHEYFQKKRFIAYLTVGYGDTVALAKTLVDAGVDILEIGVPFSDPIMDGPVIQQAMQEALAVGTTIEAVLQTCAEIKAICAVPVVLFSYVNPIYQMGEAFYREAEQSNIDAVLLVDCPIEEQQVHLSYLKKYNLGHIQLIAPNSTSEMIQTLDASNPLFHYYACRSGTTGAKNNLPDDFQKKMHDIQQYTTHPVVAGFGISSPDVAKTVCESADGFVVGSQVISLCKAGAGQDSELAHFIQQFTSIQK